MALVTCAPFMWPSGNILNAANGGESNLIDAAGEGSGGVFFVPETGVIDKVSFYLGTVTNSDAGTQITVSLYTMDTDTGFPTTTLYDTANGQWDKTGSGIITADSWNTFDFTGGDGNGAATVTKGDYITAVIVMTALGGSDSFNVETQYTSQQRQNFPVSVHDSGAGWSQKTSQSPTLVLEYATSSYVVAPELGGVDARGFTIGTDEDGVRFQVPFPCRISGVILNGMSSGPGATTFQVHLMADATIPGGARLASTPAIDEDSIQGTSNYYRWPNISFATPYEASKDTWYRLVILCTGSYTAVECLGVSNASLLQTIGTVSFYKTEENGAGWTNTTDRFVPIFPVIDQLDDGAGGAGGGLIVHPGMNGGFNG